MTRKHWHRERRAARDAGNHIREEQIKLLLAMDKNGVPDSYKVRQLRLINRVRVVAGRAVGVAES